jgi:hypothetical protein
MDLSLWNSLLSLEKFLVVYHVPAGGWLLCRLETLSVI